MPKYSWVRRRETQHEADDLPADRQGVTGQRLLGADTTAQVRTYLTAI